MHYLDLGLAWARPCPGFAWVWVLLRPGIAQARTLLMQTMPYPGLPPKSEPVATNRLPQVPTGPQGLFLVPEALFRVRRAFLGLFWGQVLYLGPGPKLFLENYLWLRHVAVDPN